MARDARFVGPVERLLYLRSIPGAMAATELANVAHYTRERFFKKGSLLLREGEPAGAVYFLVEGRVSMIRNGRVIRVIEAPFAVGFLPVLSRDPNGIEVRAEVDTVTLELGADELIDAMEDNFGLLANGVRQMSKQLVEVQRELELKGQMQREEPIETPYPEHELDLVERIVTMRKAGPYRHASLEPLVEMAKRATEVRFEPGQTLWREGEASDWGMQLVHGVVRCIGDGGERVFRMGPGSVVGYIETYASLPRGYSAVTETRVVGLRGELETFFDVLEDNFELGLTFVSFLAQLLLRLYERVAMLQGSVEAAQ